MGRWGWRVSVTVSRIVSASKSINNQEFSRNPRIRSQNPPLISGIRSSFLSFRPFSALPESPRYVEEFDVNSHGFDGNKILEELLEDEEAGKISVKEFYKFMMERKQGRSQHYGSGVYVDLKSVQAENSKYVVPPTSRSSNSIALRFCGPPWQTLLQCNGMKPQNLQGAVGHDMKSYRYMVVFQYGAAILFNVEDHEVDYYLQAVRQHASGLLTEMRKDDYAIKEKPLLVEDMQGGPDHIVLKKLDMDSIRIIGSVLGQSIALDYFVSQIDCMVEEFAQINRDMEKTGTFTMDRKKLFQLVGKANSNLADVILRVGLFERSEIAWRDAKYAQILDYLREEYEVAQRFGDLDFKLKFVEHNIHFLQEVLQNRKTDLLEWCIIVLLALENIISVYEIVRDSIGN